MNRLNHCTKRVSLLSLPYDGKKAGGCAGAGSSNNLAKSEKGDKHSRLCEKHYDGADERIGFELVSSRFRGNGTVFAEVVIC